MSDSVRVELILATADQQRLQEYNLAPGSTVAELLLAAAIADWPSLEGNIGIFARACKLSDILQEDDRVEIYRPLIADPKLQRRERAKGKVKISQVNKGRA